MRLFSLLPTTILAATVALLGASAQAGPMPTNVAAMKSMVEKDTTEVRYRAYRGGRLAYRGRLGYRGLGYGGLAAGAIVAGAVARRAYYGDGYYYGGGYPAYGYAEPSYGYGYGGGYGYAPAPYGYGGGYVARRYYGW